MPQLCCILNLDAGMILVIDCSDSSLFGSQRRVAVRLFLKLGMKGLAPLLLQNLNLVQTLLRARLRALLVKQKG